MTDAVLNSFVSMSQQVYCFLCLNGLSCLTVHYDGLCWPVRDFAAPRTKA